MKSREMDRRVRNVVRQHQMNIRADAFEKQAEEDKNRPLMVEQVAERVLIDIPDDIIRAELPALASAIYYYRTGAYTKAAAWSSMIKNYKKELTLTIETVSNNKLVQETVTRLLDIPVYNRVQLPLSPSNYDMYCQVDTKVMESFRSYKKFHSSSAYGIVLGCEAQSMFPIPVDAIIGTVELGEAVFSDILVLDDKKIWQWLGETVPLLRVSNVVPEENIFRAMIAALKNTQMVVGPTSMWTYIACCMGKPTFEIYPPGISRSWLSKWSHEGYSMYVTDSESMDKDKLLKGVSYLWYRKVMSLKEGQSRLPPASALTPGITPTVQ